MYGQKLLIFVLALAGGVVSALRVPDGDGVWMIGIDENGEETTELIAPIDEELVENVKRGIYRDGFKFQKRFDWPSGSSATCGKIIETAPTLDWEIATEHFRQSCAHATDHVKGEKNRAVLAKSGVVTAFMCSYSAGGNPCNVEEWDDAKTKIQGQCTLGDFYAKQSGKYASRSSHLFRQLTGFYIGWYSIPRWMKTYGWQATTEVC